jgi:alanine-glyoxylate transaminase/serine-glyoxylate transaminase/serine-pyruvate transaminase
VLFPASGTGAWEAALVNVSSPGDHVLMFDNGHFANLWCAMARRLDLTVDLLDTDWHEPVDTAALAERLAEDGSHRIRAVCLVHNETSTGVTSSVREVRKAMDAARHPALLLVDTVSSLGCLEYHHEEWGVDVTVSASQKGLMLPPGIAFNAVSERARAMRCEAVRARSYWDWEPIIDANRSGYFPYTPPTNLLYGLREALTMLEEEGLENVVARHARLGAATRAAVEAWGLEIFCRDEDARSNTVTVVPLPEPADPDALRRVVLDAFDMSLGAGLGRLAGRVFRIGHLGDLNDLMLCGALCGVEMGLCVAGIPHQPDGVSAAMRQLTSWAH